MLKQGLRVSGAYKALPCKTFRILGRTFHSKRPVLMMFAVPRIHSRGKDECGPTIFKSQAGIVYTTHVWDAPIFLRIHPETNAKYMRRSRYTTPMNIGGQSPAWGFDPLVWRKCVTFCGFASKSYVSGKVKFEHMCSFLRPACADHVICALVLSNHDD